MMLVCSFLVGIWGNDIRILTCYVGAILKLKDKEKIYFIFVGQGTERYKLENTIKNIILKML